MEPVALTNEEKIWLMDVPAGAKLLAFYLLREYETKGKWRHPRISRLARVTGMARTSVYRSIRELSKIGVASICGGDSNYSRYVELGASFRRQVEKEHNEPQ